MRRFIGLSSVFFLCFFLDLIVPQSKLAMPFVGFSPFLCTLLGRSSKTTMIVMAIVSGLCHDLFTLQHRLGVSSLAYLFAACLNLIFRRRYYEENILPFFSVTFCLSLSYSLFFLLFGSLKGLVISINMKMLWYQLFIYPFFDASLSVLGVFIPVKIYTLLKKLILLKRHVS
jgi:hypothetical protein